MTLWNQHWLHHYTLKRLHKNESGQNPLATMLTRNWEKKTFLQTLTTEMSQCLSVTCSFKEKPFSGVQVDTGRPYRLICLYKRLLGLPAVPAWFLSRWDVTGFHMQAAQLLFCCWDALSRGWVVSKRNLLSKLFSYLFEDGRSSFSTSDTINNQKQTGSDFLLNPVVTGWVTFWPHVTQVLHTHSPQHRPLPVTGQVCEAWNHIQKSTGGKIWADSDWIRTMRRTLQLHVLCCALKQMKNISPSEMFTSVTVGTWLIRPHCSSWSIKKAEHMNTTRGEPVRTTQTGGLQVLPSLHFI